jgi:hypothetical protein
LDAAAGERRSSAELADRGREFARNFLSLRWVPLTAALLSLPLSAAAIFLSVQQPEVLLILPDQIRVVQGRQSGSAYVYLQPAFVSTGRNERVEVIRDMNLVFVRQGADRAVFDWTQQLRLVTDPQTGALSYEYVADAVPLLVGPRSAASPLSLFDAPDEWHFVPGTYQVTLLAERVVTGQPLSADFTLTLSDADIEILDRPGPDHFLAFPITH